MEDNDDEGMIPIPASVLVDQELERRRELSRRGNIRVGCQDLDEYVLLGGFERGSVVGMSVEDVEIGLLIGLQTVARLMVTAQNANVQPKAMIITMLPVKVLLPKLRHVLVSQIAAVPGGLQNMNNLVQRCLENISISRVFDVEGLVEVLSEMENSRSTMAHPQQTTPGQVPKVRDDEVTPNTAVPPSPQAVKTKTEIEDSQDEDDSPIEKPPAHEEPPRKEIPPKPETENTSTKHTPTVVTPQTNNPPPPPPPDLILITHMTALLNGLFTGRDKPTAHDTTTALSSQLHRITRPSPPSHHSSPLILILNSTTTSFSPGTGSSINPEIIIKSEDAAPGPPIFPDQDQRRQHGPATEPTLRSVFSRQQQQWQSGVGVPRKNKPSFGLVFARLLDLHLLCTRVLRTSTTTTKSGGVAGAGPSRGEARPASGLASDGRFVWVVEVLLDEIGVYDYGGGGEDQRSERGEGVGNQVLRRRCREQRWGVIEVEEGGGRIVDLPGLGTRTKMT